MNPRDFLTTAALGLVLVVGGLAIADSVRGCGTTRTDATLASTTAPTTAPTTTSLGGQTAQADAPEGWPQGELDGVLTFVDANTCLVRAIGLSGGRERPLAQYRSNCGGLWAPKVGTRIAYETASGAGNTSFRLADLSEGDRDFGEYTAGAGGVVWSFDAQRAAWCDTPRTGVEREVLGETRPLPFCPLAYAPDGELAHAVGNLLVVGTRTVLTASGRIDLAQFGRNGSVGLVVGGRTFERYARGEQAGSAPLAGALEPPVFSPDTCKVAVSREDGIHVISLCSAAADVVLPGYAPSWSPDGAWIAAGVLEAIAFYRVNGNAGEVRWPAPAARLVWRAG